MGKPAHNRAKEGGQTGDIRSQQLTIFDENLIVSVAVERLDLLMIVQNPAYNTLTMFYLLDISAFRRLTVVNKQHAAVAG